MATSVQALWVALLTTAVGVGMVLRTSRQVHQVDADARLGLDALVRPFLVTVAAWTLMVFVAATVGELTFFDILSFLYLALVLTAPAVGSIAIVLDVVARRGRSVAALRTSTRVLAALLVLLAPLGIWMSRFEPRRLEVDHQVVVLGDGIAGEDEVRIAVIADIQTTAIGPHERRAVRMVLAQHPDIVLIAGDLFQGTQGQWDKSFDDFQAILHDLASVPGGAFVVEGDVDQPREVGWLIEGTGVRLLSNEVAEVAIGDRQLRILGLPLLPDPASEGALARFAAEPDDGAGRIVLSHRPDWAQRFGEGPAGVDLVVAGHTHGGQVQLPAIGPLMTMTEIPRRMAGGGLHDLDGQALYVSTGVGMEQQGAPQVRLVARPSIGLLLLR